MMQKISHIDEQLDAYLDGELSHRQRRMVARHLRGCASCRKKWQEKRVLSMELRSLPVRSCPEHVVEQVMQQARSVGRPKRRWLPLAFLRKPAFAWRLGTGLAVATTVALFLVFWPAEKTSLPTTQYSPEEVAKAKSDVERALGYLTEVLELTQQTIEQEVVPKQVVEPLKMGLKAAFGSLQENGG